MRRPAHRDLRAVLLLVAMLLAGACRVDVVTEIDVEDDGSGVVRVSVALDADAAARVPELADQLDVEDLRMAGWTVRGPVLEDDGRTVLRADKAFTTPAQAGAVVGEVSGPDGPLRDVVVERRTSTFSTSFSLRGRADLRAGVEAFGDQALRARLDGTSLGVGPAELEAEIGVPLAEAVGVQVITRLPGSDQVIRDVRLGEEVGLDAEAEVTNRTRVVLGAVAVVALVLLVLLGVLATVRRWRRAPSPST